MHITLNTDTKLILQIFDNQLLNIGLQAGGFLMALGVLMFNTDFTTNPDYNSLSAQNLNFAIRAVSIILVLMGLAFIGFSANNRHEFYIFDKETGLLTVQGKGIARALKQTYPLTHIQQVVVGKTEFHHSTSGAESYSIAPSAPEYWIGLEFHNSTSTLFLQHRSPDQSAVNELANSIRQFLGHSVVSHENVNHENVNHEDQ